MEPFLVGKKIKKNKTYQVFSRDCLGLRNPKFMFTFIMIFWLVPTPLFCICKHSNFDTSCNDLCNVHSIVYSHVLKVINSSPCLVVHNPRFCVVAVVRVVVW